MKGCTYQSALFTKEKGRELTIAETYPSLLYVFNVPPSPDASPIHCHKTLSSPSWPHAALSRITTKWWCKYLSKVVKTSTKRIADMVTIVIQKKRNTLASDCKQNYKQTHVLKSSPNVQIILKVWMPIQVRTTFFFSRTTVLSLMREWVVGFGWR